MKTPKSKLRKAFEESSFNKGEFKWLDDDGECFSSLDGKDNGFFYVAEGATLGDTLIQLTGHYENCGADCFFIQELIRKYKNGQLREGL